MKFAWRLIAPDGTIVKAQSGYMDIYGGGPDTLGAGEKAEAHIKVKGDPRAVKLTIKIESNDEYR
jgi:hypothetical protein